MERSIIDQNNKNTNSPSPTRNSYTAPKLGPLRQGQPMDLNKFNSHSNNSTGVGGGAGNHLNSGVNVVVQTKEVLDEIKNKQEVWGSNYEPSEDSIRNDYSENYVLTGERPQNHLRGTNLADRFSEYPKLEALLQLKHTLLSSSSHSIPPTYHLTETPQTSLPLLPSARFDVVLLTPDKNVTYEELRGIDLASVASTPGFIWLWVGSGLKGDGGVGLELGRELLAGWGYRRCEDIVWLKTNKSNPTSDLTSNTPTSLLNPTIEHCLMGIRGTVRRSTDPWFVHCNVDTDVIVWEGDKSDPQLKPPELQSLIENFCQGTRRLHLYGSKNSLRRGWLTIGSEFATSSSTTTSDLISSLKPIVIHPIPLEPRVNDWITRVYEKEDYLRMFSGKGFGVVKIPRENSRNRISSTGRKGFSDRIGEINLNGEISAGDGVDEDSGDSEDSEESDEEDVEEKEGDRAVEVLLPFMEELEALRPKSPPARDGALPSGGLGRGRGAGLGVTRSLMINNNNNSNSNSHNMNGNNMNGGSNLGGRSNIGRSNLSNGGGGNRFQNGGGSSNGSNSGGSSNGGNSNSRYTPQQRQNGGGNSYVYNQQQQQQSYSNNNNNNNSGYSNSNSNSQYGSQQSYPSYSQYSPQQSSQQYQQQSYYPQSPNQNSNSYSSSNYSNQSSPNNGNMNQNSRRQQSQRQQQMNQAAHRPSSQLHLQQSQQYYQQQMQIAQQQLLISQAAVAHSQHQQALLYTNQQIQLSQMSSGYSPSPSSPPPSSASLPLSDSFTDGLTPLSPQTPDMYANWLSTAGRRPSEMHLGAGGGYLNSYPRSWGSIDDTGRRQSQIGLPVNGQNNYEYEYEYELEQREREEGGLRRESVAYGGMGPGGMGMGGVGLGVGMTSPRGGNGGSPLMHEAQFEGIEEDGSVEQ